MNTTMIFLLIYLILNYHFSLVTSDKCFKSICIPSENDKLVKPPIVVKCNENSTIFNNATEFENTTLLIHVHLENVQILRIDENEHAITIKLTLILAWEEPRIIISPNASKEDVELNYHDDKLGDLLLHKLPKDFANDLWLPGLYIKAYGRGKIILPPIFEF